MTTVLDASIVIAALSEDDVHHHKASNAIDEACDRGPVVLPASAFAEVRVGARRQGDAGIAGLERFVRQVAPLVLVDRGVAEHASDLRARYRSLRLPDALVIGTAHALDAVTVLTTDTAWAKFSDRVRVVA